MEKYNRIMETVMFIIAVSSTVFIIMYSILGNFGANPKDYVLLMLPVFAFVSWGMRRHFRRRVEAFKRQEEQQD